MSGHAHGAPHVLFVCPDVEHTNMQEIGRGAEARWCHGFRFEVGIVCTSKLCNALFGKVFEFCVYLGTRS